jgi:hypothetical protein
MLFLRAKFIKIVSKIPKIKYWRGKNPSLYQKYIKKEKIQGKIKLVNPVILVRAKIKNQRIKRGKKNLIPIRAKDAPKNVEAPLPPCLNFKKIGRL